MQQSVIKRNSVSYSCNLDIADPITMLEYGQLAEEAGFTAIWASDHFQPWFHTGAKESQAWIWLTALLSRTKKIPVGTGVTAPILRYHPGIIAQAFATMEAIYGPRVFLTLGAGEALNELPLGYSWIGLKERRERVAESAIIIRKLISEDFVNFEGKHFNLKNANMYMRASFPIFIGASGPKMAEVVGELGDGFLTIKGADYAKSELFPAVERGAKKAGRNPDDIIKAIEIDLSYDTDLDRALIPLRTQAGPLLPKMFTDPIFDPREIEREGKQVTDEELTKAYVLGSSPEDFIKPIEAAFEAGFDHVYLASLSPNEKSFIRMCGEKVLPYFSGKN
ncbi:MAG: LLM class flavin-dependent oxidoreductase [Thaumarchaeota archaeon]|nr:LLM class flavin-dependent oxidoreductase [Nitrososphaerota archaeon]